jgi:hypothetical protein
MFENNTETLSRERKWRKTDMALLKIMSTPKVQSRGALKIDDYK